MTDKIAALIARLERATGASWELDEDIMCCVYADLKPERHMEGWYSASGDHIRVDRYTSSLDAALLLVPEGWEWLRKNHLSMTVYQVPDNDKTWARHIDGAGPTPAIALCVAALKARSAAT